MGGRVDEGTGSDAGRRVDNEAGRPDMFADRVRLCRTGARTGSMVGVAVRENGGDVMS